MDALPGWETVSTGHTLQSTAVSAEFQVPAGQSWQVLSAQALLALEGVPGENVPALHGLQPTSDGMPAEGFCSKFPYSLSAVSWW
jgi:hypothetical protein